MHVYIYVYIILSVIVFFSSLSFYGEWTIPGTKRQPAILNLIDGVFLISSRDMSSNPLQYAEVFTSAERAKVPSAQRFSLLHLNDILQPVRYLVVSRHTTRVVKRAA